jgi:hypothetical protein
VTSAADIAGGHAHAIGAPAPLPIAPGVSGKSRLRMALEMP